MECIFCDIIANRKPGYKVWENDDFVVILDIAPINPGHVLLIPKIHCADVYELPVTLYDKLFQIVKKIAGPLKRATAAARIGMAIEGFGVPHVHVHLVPVNGGNELNPERAKRATECELRQMQELLDTAFKELP